MQETLDVPLMMFVGQKSKFKHPVEPIKDIYRRIRPRVVVNKAMSSKEKQLQTFAPKSGEYGQLWAEKVKTNDGVKLTLDVILKGVHKYITIDRFLGSIED